MASNVVSLSAAKKKKKGTAVLKPYKTYKFSGQDPIVAKVRDVFDEAGAKMSTVHKDSGVSTSTMANWWKKKTKRPQFATVNAVLMALDMELQIGRRK